eukprot:TRINITY_DN22748_c0_g1_i1.p1 TRINITY_DN22748_c0_g1~~TRINITY_DN22748_c0_g1_i1.p1  ORF type:complete len:860 (-),score=111.83 TRINITY_DN22748_c0_g1_i1:104-2644(-)
MDDASSDDEVKKLDRDLAAEDASAGREALVKRWWDESRPKKGGTIAPLPAGARVDFLPLLQIWLEQRGLEETVEREPDHQGYAVFRLRDPAVREKPGWEVAYHGTRWYALWLILKSGLLLESNDKDLGHDFWEPGVYCSPVLETARWYARPHILFGDECFHRAVLELRVDPARRKRARQRGGVQWVFPRDAISVRAVWFDINAPPSYDEDRFLSWDPELEALPPGTSAPSAICNPREGPWPAVDADGYPLEPEDGLPGSVDAFDEEEEDDAEADDGDAVPWWRRRAGEPAPATKNKSQPRKERQRRKGGKLIGNHGGKRTSDWNAGWRDAAGVKPARDPDIHWSFADADESAFDGQWDEMQKWSSDAKTHYKKGPEPNGKGSKFYLMPTSAKFSGAPPSGKVATAKSLMLNSQLSAHVVKKSEEASKDTSESERIHVTAHASSSEASTKLEGVTSKGGPPKPCIRPPAKHASVAHSCGSGPSHEDGSSHITQKRVIKPTPCTGPPVQSSNISEEHSTISGSPSKDAFSFATSTTDRKPTPVIRPPAKGVDTSAYPKGVVQSSIIGPHLGPKPVISPPVMLSKMPATPLGLRPVVSPPSAPTMPAASFGPKPVICPPSVPLPSRPHILRPPLPGINLNSPPPQQSIAQWTQWTAADSTVDANHSMPLSMPGMIAPGTDSIEFHSVQTQAYVKSTVVVPPKALGACASFPANVVQPWARPAGTIVECSPPPVHMVPPVVLPPGALNACTSSSPMSMFQSCPSPPTMKTLPMQAPTAFASGKENVVLTSHVVDASFSVGTIAATMPSETAPGGSFTGKRDIGQLEQADDVQSLLDALAAKKRRLLESTA